MEAFSLLKYWRGGGGGTPVSASSDCRETSGTTTIVTAVARDAVDSDGEGNDDGPFFDLEFAVPDDEDEAEDKDEEEEDGNEDDNVSTCAENGEENDEDDEDSDGGGTDGEREFNFTLSSGSSNDRADPNLALSPSDDLFFKGRLVPVEPSSLALTNIGAEPNSAKPPQFPVSLLKSATKFRVMMLGFKKSKQSVAEKAEPTRASSPKKHKPPLATAAESKEKKFLTVKFKVEEVPIMSLFTRDNSTARTSSTNKPPASQKQSSASAAAPSEELASSDEKRFSKDVMQKYLKKVKPLYVRVSKRYGDKLRFSGQLNSGSGAKPAQAPPSTEAQKPAPTPRPAASTEKNTKPVTAATESTAPSTAKTHKQVNIPAGLREVCKHLGKSRSASSAVAAAPPGPVISKRRDDSLLQQQDGIQSAILHCKRSFNASRDSESSVLRRSASEPAEEKISGGADNKSRISFKEEDGVA